MAAPLPNFKLQHASQIGHKPTTSLYTPTIHQEDKNVEKNLIEKPSFVGYSRNPPDIPSGTRT